MQNKNNTGILHWGKKESLEGAQTSYYDLSYFKVPFTGVFNPHKIRTVLSHRYPNTGNYFGGYTTIGSIEQFDETHVKVELVYHIGN